MRKAPPLQVEEISGDKYPDLETAQRAALPFLSASLEAILRDLLERGVLVKNADGKIVPAAKDKT